MSLPNPLDVAKGVIAQFMGEIPPDFDPKDLGEIRITFGDCAPVRDGHLDMRVRIYARAPGGEQPKPIFMVGPKNVPTEELLRVGSAMVSVVPAPAAPIAATVLNVTANGVGVLEKLLLK